MMSSFEEMREAQRSHWSRLGSAEATTLAVRNAKNKSSVSTSRRFVNHEYQDHSRDVVSPYLNGTMECRFPDRLHRLLDDTSGLSHVLSWQPHGRCFLVRDRTAFVEQILPRYFKQTKMTSFQRQLNIYGFKRLTAGLDKDAYYHEFFLRQRPDLCARMQRMKLKGTGVKATPSPRTEPNFYTMWPSCEQSIHALQTSDVDTPTSTPPMRTSSTSQRIYHVISPSADKSMLTDPIEDFTWEKGLSDGHFAPRGHLQNVSERNLSTLAWSDQATMLLPDDMYEPLGSTDDIAECIDVTLLRRWLLNFK